MFEDRLKTYFSREKLSKSGGVNFSRPEYFAFSILDKSKVPNVTSSVHTTDDSITLSWILGKAHSQKNLNDVFETYEAMRTFGAREDILQTNTYQEIIIASKDREADLQKLRDIAGTEVNIENAERPNIFIARISDNSCNLLNTFRKVLDYKWGLK